MLRVVGSAAFSRRLGRRRRPRPKANGRATSGDSKVRLASCGGDAICGSISWLRASKDDPGKVGQQVFFDMKPSGDNAWAGRAFNPRTARPIPAR